MSPDGNTVYAVTTGSFWYTRDFGTTWGNVTPPTESSSGFWPSTNWTGVSASADGSVVMLGQSTDSTGPIVSVDSGFTWTRRAIHTGTAPTYQGAVAADGSLLVQTRWNDATTKGLWVSRDLGVSWTNISAVDFADVALSANRQKIVATTRFGRKAHVFSSSDNYATVSGPVISATLGTNGDMTDSLIAISSDGSRIVAGSSWFNGGLHFSSDGGTTWTSPAALSVYVEAAATSADGYVVYVATTSRIKKNAAITTLNLNSSSPADGDTGVSPSADITLTFDTTPEAVTGKNIKIVKTSDSATTTIAADDATQVSVGGNTVTINPSSDLAENTAYHVLLDAGAFRVSSGGADHRGIYTATELNFTTGSTDITAPTVQTLLPANSATDVAISADLVVTFSENVSAVSSKYIRICTGTSSCTGSTVTGDVVQVLEATNAAITISTNQVTINPASHLNPNTTYYVSIDSGAFRDSSSNNYAGLAAGASWSFTTGNRTALVHLRANDYTAGATSWTNQGSLGVSANITAATGGMTREASGVAAVTFAGKESSNSDRVSGTIGASSSKSKVSVEMWLYMEDNGSTQNSSGSMLFSWDAGLSGSNYNIYHFQDRVGFNVFQSELYGITSSSLNNGWQHFVFVMAESATAADQKIYLNGVLQSLTCDPLGSSHSACSDGATAQSRRDVPADGDFFIMDNGSSLNTWNVKGRLGLVRIFDAELSQIEVTTKFDATKNDGFLDSTPPTTTTTTTTTVPATTTTTSTTIPTTTSTTTSTTVPATTTATTSTTVPATTSTTTTTVPATTTTTSTTTTTTTSTTVPATTTSLPRRSTSTTTPTASATSTVPSRQSVVTSTTSPIYERQSTDPSDTTTTSLVPPTTVPTAPASGPESAFITSDDEIEVMIQGVDANESPSAINSDGRLILTVGNFIKVRGSGFTNAGFAEVWLFSTPQLLGRVPKSASGEFLGRVRVPEAMTNGNHTIELRARTRRGRSVLMSVPAIVIGGSNSPGVVDAQPQVVSATETTLPVVTDNEPTAENLPILIETEPGATEVVVPIEVITEVVTSVLPVEITPSETEVEVRTNVSNWQLVNMNNTEPVVLPLGNDTSEVDVRATTQDGQVFEGSIAVATRRSNDRLILATALGVLAIGIFGVWFVARRRRKDDDDNR